MDLAVAQEIEAAIGRREGAARADRPEDALARVDDEGKARREGGERERDDGVAVNAGSAACR
jgi:hypothetical protein